MMYTVLTVYPFVILVLSFNFLATTGPSGVRSLLLKQVGLIVLHEIPKLLFILSSKSVYQL